VNKIKRRVKHVKDIDSLRIPLNREALQVSHNGKEFQASCTRICLRNKYDPIKLTEIRREIRRPIWKILAWRSHHRSFAHIEA
jgi:hypothetical protein